MMTAPRFDVYDCTCRGALPSSAQRVAIFRCAGLYFDNKTVRASGETKKPLDTSLSHYTALAMTVRDQLIVKSRGSVVAAAIDRRRRVPFCLAPSSCIPRSSLFQLYEERRHSWCMRTTLSVDQSPLLTKTRMTIVDNVTNIYQRDSHLFQFVVTFLYFIICFLWKN